MIRHSLIPLRMPAEQSHNPKGADRCSETDARSRCIVLEHVLRSTRKPRRSGCFQGWAPNEAQPRVLLDASCNTHLDLESSLSLQYSHALVLHAGDPQHCNTQTMLHDEPWGTPTAQQTAPPHTCGHLCTNAPVRFEELRPRSSSGTMRRQRPKHNGGTEASTAQTSTATSA